MGDYKHYIRIDTNNNVIYGFSNAFEQPITNDIQLTGDFGRRFEIQLVSPLPRPQFLYKLVNGAMVARTQSELDAELNTISKRRQLVLDKWDPQIDTQRETLRKLQDEDKPAASITKAKTNLHNLVASKNTELAGVL